MKNLKEEASFMNERGENIELSMEASFSIYEPPSLKERLSKVGPIKEGLFPHELVMLVFVQRWPIERIVSHSYWKYQVSGSKPKEMLSSLYQRGYIEFADINTALLVQPMPVLREELKLLNQKTGGSKKDLVERLLIAADNSTLKDKYSDCCYMLTPKGETALAEHPYVNSFMYRRYDLDVWDIWCALQRDTEGQTYRDVIWQKLLAKAQEQLNTGKYGLYRNTHLHMAEFLIDQGFDDGALRHLCEVIAFDLSPCYNGGVSLFTYKKTSIQKLKDYFFEREIQSRNPKYGETKIIKPFLSTPSIILEMVEHIKVRLNLSTEEFRAKIQKYFYQFTVPGSVFMPHECVDYVIFSITGSNNKVQDMYATVYEREVAKHLVN